MSDKWHYAYEGSGAHTIYAMDGKRIVGAAEEGEGFNREEATYNARLMAAAQDLLEACRIARDEFEELNTDKDRKLNPHLIGKMNSALAKATYVPATARKPPDAHRPWRNGDRLTGDG